MAGIRDSRVWPTALWHWIVVCVGVALIVVGTAAAVAGPRAAADARQDNDLAVLMGGADLYDPNAGAAGEAWAATGILIVFVGFVTLAGYAVARAVRR